jgi:hypothetical protein
MHALVSTVSIMHAFVCTCACTPLRTPVCEHDLRTHTPARANYHCMHKRVHEGNHLVHALAREYYIPARDKHHCGNTRTDTHLCAVRTTRRCIYLNTTKINAGTQPYTTSTNAGTKPCDKHIHRTGG